MSDFESFLDDVRYRILPLGGETLRSVVFTELYQEILDLSPVATGLYRASNAPSSGEPLYLKLDSVGNYPVKTVADATSVVNSSTVFDTLFVSNAAQGRGSQDSFAELIEGGRRIDSRGRMVGSLRAQYGVYNQAIKNVEGRHEQIELSVVEKMKNVS